MIVKNEMSRDVLDYLRIKVQFHREPLGLSDSNTLLNEIDRLREEMAKMKSMAKRATADLDYLDLQQPSLPNKIQLSDGRGPKFETMTTPLVGTQVKNDWGELSQPKPPCSYDELMRITNKLRTALLPLGQLICSDESRDDEPTLLGRLVSQADIRKARQLEKECYKILGPMVRFVTVPEGAVIEDVSGSGDTPADEPVVGFNNIPTRVTEAPLYNSQGELVSPPVVVNPLMLAPTKVRRHPSSHA